MSTPKRRNVELIHSGAAQERERARGHRRIGGLELGRAGVPARKMGCAGSKSTNVVEGPTVPLPVKAAPAPSAKPVEAPPTKREAEVDAKPAEPSQSVTWAERQWKKATDASQVDLTAIDSAIEDGGRTER